MQWGTRRGNDTFPLLTGKIKSAHLGADQETGNCKIHKAHTGAEGKMIQGEIV